MEHYTSYIIHLDQHLPLHTHFPLTLDGIKQLHYLFIKSLEGITCPIFAARYPLSNSDKLLNIW